jgi:hypothetical protein
LRFASLPLFFAAKRICSAVIGRDMVSLQIVGVYSAVNCASGTSCRGK